MESNQVATKSVLVIFWHVLKLVEKKLLEDVICRVNVFVDERTWINNRKAMKVKDGQCGVTRVTGFREHINARHERIKVRVNKITER